MANNPDVPQRIGRFVVQSELGRGGMGVVYRAEDPTLGRAVALKLLPPEVSRAFHAREQLLAEARAAAVLDHPNICTVYEVGESSEGDLYLAMALYEGETLATRLERGRLTLAEATDVAIQTAQGLAFAHAIGVVHRDIKPSNLILTRGGPVDILDFGMVAARRRDRTGADAILFDRPSQWCRHQRRRVGGRSAMPTGIECVPRFERTLCDSNVLFGQHNANATKHERRLLTRRSYGGLLKAPAIRSVRSIRCSRVAVARQISMGPGGALGESYSTRIGSNGSLAGAAEGL